MSGLTLDAGALNGFERTDRAVVAIFRALQLGQRFAIPAGVIGQVWRDGRQQVRLIRLLGSNLIEIESLDDKNARLAGQLFGAANTNDIIDASVVLCARKRGHGVFTSDGNDLRRLTPSLRYVAI